MLNYHYNDEENRLELVASGMVNANELVEYYKHIEDNIVYPRKLKALSSSGDANFSFSHKDVSKIMRAAINAAKKYDLVQEAIIIKGPYITALGFIFQKITIHRKFKVKIFSTEKAALEWLYTDKS